MTKEIQYSRHARRRMSLYNISETDILSVIEHHNRKLDFSEGKHEIIGETVFSQYQYVEKVLIEQTVQKFQVQGTKKVQGRSPSMLSMSSMVKSALFFKDFTTKVKLFCIGVSQCRIKNLVCA